MLTYGCIGVHNSTIILQSLKYMLHEKDSYYMNLTKKQLELLCQVIRIEFDCTQSDKRAEQLIELALSLELYELVIEMKKDLIFK